MSEFLQALLQFPSILFAGFLGISLLYWILVIIGAADLNPFDGVDGLDGAADGGLEGAVKGGVEGAVKGAVHGVLPDPEAVHASPLTEALAFLGLTKVPLTVSFSVFSLVGWFLSVITRQGLDPHIPGFASAAAATAAAIIGGFAVTSVVSKSIAGVFTETTRVGKEGLIGRVVKVSSEVADDHRGQGEIDDGAGGIVIAIRTSRPEVALKRGDEAIVVEHDEKAGTYTVEPQANLTPTEAEQLAAPVEPVEVGSPKPR